MEIKLKSTLSQIPWWLACKAIFIALSWFIFPFWLFFLVANYFYWLPFFAAGVFLVPFVLTLLLSAVGEPTGWLLAGIGSLFFLILGAKELAFIHRARVYEVLSVVLLFLGCLQIASFIQGKDQIGLPFIYLAVAFIFFLLRDSAFRYERSHRGDAAIPQFPGKQQFLESALPAFLFFGYGSIVSGFPLEVLPKSAVLFAGAIAFFFLTPFEGHQLPLEKLGRYLGILTAAIIIIFITSSWTL
ncbi:MAG: hypothetical protein FJY98_01340 [Candidatus Liptonbacteria bacterium]|nr:hypothetical protein [Candidatus Liptonbacteria bacterium]